MRPTTKFHRPVGQLEGSIVTRCRMSFYVGDRAIEELYC